jgi:NADH-quinone oxidoreductase subunit E
MSKQEMDMGLSAVARAKIDAWLEKYPADQKRSATLPALTIVQEENDGFLTTALMDRVADYLGLAPIEVYEVGTFYSMFDLEPVGRHKISVCTNISCMLCGAEDIVGHIENKLGIRLGQTSADGRITLKVEEECLAACGGGPMMVVDGHYYENLTPATVDSILDSLE